MKRNKFTAILLAFCLTLSLCIPVMAAGTTLKIESPAKLPQVGETFTVKVHIRDNPGVNAVQFTLAFDQSVVDCTAADQGAAIGNMLCATNPDAPDGAILAAAGVQVATQDGTLGEFTFKVLKSGNPALKLQDALLSDEDGNEMPFTVETVKSEEVRPEAGGSGGQPESKPVEKPEVRPEDKPAEGHARQQFTDVSADYWAYDYVTRAADLGLVTGYEDGTFRPGKPVTRAQFVTMLWRMAGTPDAGSQTGFTDVPADAWCAAPVSWASQNGYVNGVTATSFNPNGIITREQAMAILFRYSGSNSGMEAMLYGIYDKQFTDSASIGSWSKNAVYWAIYNGIMNGVTETTVVPKGTATRAQISAIFLRYMDKVA